MGQQNDDTDPKCEYTRTHVTMLVSAKEVGMGQQNDGTDPKC